MLPDAIEAVYLKENIVEGSNENFDQLISDYGSGLYGTFFSLGQILAPVLGGILYQFLGYRQTTDFIALSSLLWSGIFFVFNVGIRIFQQERKIKIKKEMLKEKKEENTCGEGDDDEEEELEEFLKKQRQKWKDLKKKKG